MTDKDLLRLMLNQVNKSFEVAKKEGVEGIALYTEYFEKLSLLSGRKKGFTEVNERNLKYAVVGNIRSKAKITAALNITRKFLSSKWASPEGRQQIYEKSIKTGTANKAVSVGVYDKSVKYMARVEKHNKEVQRRLALHTVDTIENAIIPDLEEEWLPPSELIFIINEIIEDNDLPDNFFYDAIDYVKNNAVSLESLDDMRDAVYHFFDNILEP